MFCSNCGSPVSVGDAFCGACGARFEVVPVQETVASESAQPIENQTNVQPVAEVAFQQPPVQEYQQPVSQNNVEKASVEANKSKNLAVIIPVCVVAVVLAIVAIVVLPKVLNNGENSGTVPTEQGGFGEQDIVGADDLSEEQENVKTYSEDDVKEFFNWLTDTYNGDISSQVFYLDENNFSNILLEWFMPKDQTYQIYKEYISYSDLVSGAHQGVEDILIEDVMSEREFNTLLNSDRECFDIFKVTDVQENIDAVWGKGRFNAEDLDDGSFSSRYITSKGYIVVAIDPTDSYGFTKARYVSYEKSGDEYLVKAYMLSVNPGMNSQNVYDISTDMYLGDYSDLDYVSSEKSFSQILSAVGKTTGNLQPVEFVFEGTADGLRFKKLNFSKVLPDVKGNFGTKYVTAGGEGLNIRTAPSKTATIVGLAFDDEPVYIRGKSDSTDEWVYIYFYDDEGISYSGWVNKNYLR